MSYLYGVVQSSHAELLQFCLHFGIGLGAHLPFVILELIDGKTTGVYNALPV